jgi:hypothetical protein
MGTNSDPVSSHLSDFIPGKGQVIGSPVHVHPAGTLEIFKQFQLSLFGNLLELIDDLSGGIPPLGGSAQRIASSIERYSVAAGPVNAVGHPVNPEEPLGPDETSRQEHGCWEAILFEDGIREGVRVAVPVVKGDRYSVRWEPILPLEGSKKPVERDDTMALGEMAHLVFEGRDRWSQHLGTKRLRSLPVLA